jgi:hypothetical protein
MGVLGVVLGRMVYVFFFDTHQIAQSSISIESFLHSPITNLLINPRGNRFRFVSQSISLYCTDTNTCTSSTTSTCSGSCK